jgi:hypothetical protein
MASSDVDGLPWWLTPVARGLRRVFPSRFRAAVRDDPRPHLARVARFQLKDPNVRPADATRLRRLAGLAAAEPGAARACRRRTGRPETAPRSRKPFVIMGMWPIQVR